MHRVAMRTPGSGPVPEGGPKSPPAPCGFLVGLRDLRRERQVSNDKHLPHQTSPCGNGRDIRMGGAGSAFMMPEKSWPVVKEGCSVSTKLSASVASLETREFRAQQESEHGGLHSRHQATGTGPPVV